MVADDDSADDSANFYKAPYDAATEKEPRCPIYHPSFAVVQSCIADILRLIGNPLDTSPYTDKSVNALKNELKKCLNGQSFKEARFALVGDVGSGKSSITNSLLGVGVMARKVSISHTFIR